MRVLGVLIPLFVALSALAADDHPTADQDHDKAREEMARAREDMRRARDELREAVRAQREQSRNWSWSWGKEPHLGMMIRDDTEGGGVQVDAVTPGSPADKAGMKAGDLLLVVNGKSLKGGADGGTPGVSRVMSAIRDAKDGEAVALEFRRGKDSKKASIVPEAGSGRGWGVGAFSEGDDDVHVMIPDIPEIPEVHVEGPHVFVSHSLSEKWRDMDLTSLNPELGEYFGASAGVLVLKAPPNATLPIKSGDVLLKIGDRQPTTPSQAVRIFRSYEPGEMVKVELMRKKDKQTLSFKMPDR